jgi:hypothetical protein
LLVDALPMHFDRTSAQADLLMKCSTPGFALFFFSGSALVRMQVSRECVTYVAVQFNKRCAFSVAFGNLKSAK